MLLSDKDIKKYIEQGKIKITPNDLDNYIQPASVDLRLGKHFLVFDKTKNYVIDPKRPIDEMMRKVEINNDGYFILHPGEFALGITYENITLSGDILGRLDGKSSVARMGIFVHVTAASHFPGASSNMTLELYNASTIPVKLYYKMPIAQMLFEKLSSEVETDYNHKVSKYSNDSKPKASQFYKNFEKK